MISIVISLNKDVEIKEEADRESILRAKKASKKVKRMLKTRRMGHNTWHDNVGLTQLGE